MLKNEVCFSYFCLGGYIISASSVECNYIFVVGPFESNLCRGATLPKRIKYENFFKDENVVNWYLFSINIVLLLCCCFAGNFTKKILIMLHCNTNCCFLHSSMSTAFSPSRIAKAGH